jgi:hypothetical protein
MLLAASFLALSFAQAPAPPCVAPTQTGIFRITATTKDSSNASVGLLLLENVNNCLEASIVAEEAGPSIIEQVEMKNDVLTGRVHMRQGMGQVTLRLSAVEIEGSIVSGKSTWLVSGRRTTGAEVQSANGDVARTRTP